MNEGNVIGGQTKRRIRNVHTRIQVGRPRPNTTFYFMKKYSPKKIKTTKTIK